MFSIFYLPQAQQTPFRSYLQDMLALVSAFFFLCSPCTYVGKSSYPCSLNVLLLNYTIHFLLLESHVKFDVSFCLERIYCLRISPFDIQLWRDQSVILFIFMWDFWVFTEPRYYAGEEGESWTWGPWSSTSLSTHNSLIKSLQSSALCSS